MRLLSLMPAVLIAPVLVAQTTGRVRYIPALAYGPNVWSVLRLTNSGTTPQTVGLDVYREDGTQLPIGPAFEVRASTTREIRIDDSAATDEICWARVTLPDAVEARGFVEVLKGDTLEDFPREAHELSDRARWTTLTSAVAGKYFYFLNAAERPTVVTFCATDQPRPDACSKKGITSIRVPAGPRQLIGVRVRRPRRRFFITESSAPGAAVLTLFDSGPGDKRSFGSKSSVEFGEPQP